MEKVRILSKKAFAFGPGASRDGKTVDQFVTVPGAIQEIPKQYTKEKLFQLAVKEGSVVLMEGKVQIGTPTFRDVEPVVEEKSPEEELKEMLKGMSKAEVKDLAKKYGAEFDEESKLSENKKRVLEAYKLTLTDEE